MLEASALYVRLVLNCVRKKKPSEKCTPTNPLVETLTFSLTIEDKIYTSCQQPPRAEMSLSASNRCASSKLSTAQEECERKIRVAPDPGLYFSMEKEKNPRCFYGSVGTFSPDINGRVNWLTSVMHLLVVSSCT